MINYKFKKLFKSKNPRLFLQTFLLLSGLVAGIVLVLQPQLLGSSALEIGYDLKPSNLETCPFASGCQEGPAKGAVQCRGRSGSGTYYCCRGGQRIINNICTNYKECGSGRYCAGARPNGAEACVGSDGSFNYCCPVGQIIKNQKCVTPYIIPNPGSSPKPFDCTKASWINGQCGGGGCGRFRYQFKILPASCGMATSRCIPDSSCL